MTFRSLLLRNLFFHWRTNLAVLLGVVAATAVISGALIVGDSVRDSLVQMSKDRLGKIDDAVLGKWFFREALAGELQEAVNLSPEEENSNDPLLSVAPVLMLPGSLQYRQSEDQLARAGQIQVYGATSKLWEMLDHGDLTLPGSGEAVINKRVADQLGVAVGDEISLIIEIPSAIPRDALLGERNETATELPLKVTGIAPDALGIARLGMNPTQQIPSNIFVSLPDLQSQMGLQKVVPSRRNPEAKPARVNTLFISHSLDGPLTDAVPDDESASRLTRRLQSQLTLSDIGLRLVKNEEHGYLSLESEQMFLEGALSKPAFETANELHLSTSPVLVYLANEIWKVKTPETLSMYSVIAGIDPQESPPFGPFEFRGEHHPLQGDAVWINSWLADDLKAKVGDEIRIKYHVVGDRGELPEEEQTFTVAGIVELTGPADDRGFTPHVPGVTDAETYADWREPFPLKREKITDRDDDYWEEYRTTPKIFVSLKTAQRLWKSRYGDLSLIRLAPRAGQSLSELADAFTAKFLSKLDLVDLGLAVQPVRLIGLRAAQGTTDFTGLFIGFSFFLILSAALLIGLLFRLGVEQRWSEIGLYSAIGFSPRQIRRLLLLEGGLLALVGGLLGLVAGIGYAALMIYGLKTWWYGAIGTKFLYVSVRPASLLTGFLIADAVAMFVIWWAQRQTHQQSTRSLLSGDVASAATWKSPRVSRYLALIAGGGSLVLLAVTLAGLIPDVEAFGGFSWRVVVFFVVGIGFLVASLAGFAVVLSSSDAFPLTGAGSRGDARLGFKNAARNRSRSVLTASLIASATFVIVAVACGQMNPIGEAPDRQSGNGGFTLVAQSTIPLLYDLNSTTGRSKLGFNVQNEQQMKLLNEAKFFPFRMQPGENASCLNLYQTQLPTVLGVPDDVLETFLTENRFRFADTPSDHPWSLLKEERPEGRLPVLGDMNTLMYSLHKGIGQTIPVPNAEHPEHTLEVVGMFANSIFQGVLVMSESNFLKLFPDQAGFRYFLIQVDPAQADALSRLLESRLADYGFDSERVSRRLADFLSVQNTYLSTFQTLGGLGLLLGTLGLATVMLRNVLERARELSLLRAVGFQRKQIARLVAWENAVLLGSGLFCGTAAALLAMSPHLSSTAASVPWWSLVGLLAAVLIVGMLAALLAVRAAVRLPILSTLRGD